MGRLHVDDMLDEMTPQEFAEWHAYYFVEPWGDDWRQVGRLGSVLHNDLLHLRAANEKIEEDDWQTEEDYIPRLSDEEEEDEGVTPEEISELMQEWYGSHR